MSLTRSTTCAQPSSSTRSTSPVRNHPPSTKAAAVSSGRFQYPANTCGPRTASSAGGPAGGLGPVGAQQRDVGEEVRHPDRRRVGLRAVVGAHVDAGRRLGHAVALHEPHAAGEPRPGHPLLHGGAAVLHERERAQVGGVPRRVLAHHLQHRRHGREARDPPCDTRCEDQAGVGLRQDVDAPALEQRGQRDLAEPDAVEQRGDAQRLVGAQHVDVGEEVDGVPGHAAVGEHRALGAARRARGVEDQGGVLERDRRRLVEGRARRDLRRVVQRARVAARVHASTVAFPASATSAAASALCTRIEAPESSSM